ncbi:MAG: VOC family protein [Isosphaeraceae bacterium]|nr:VOC family protein [Isosphaeraceae bacterium]
MTPHGVLETSVYVRDLDAAERFYAGVLGLPLVGRMEGRHVFFRCGRGVLLVFNPDVTGTEPTWVDGSVIPLHGTQGSGHVAFAIREDEIEPWRQRLAEAGVALESEVAWPGGGHSLYFRDPDGNSLELATPRLWGLDEDAVLP